MDAFLSIIPCFNNIFRKCYSYKNTILPEICSKGVGKAFLVKTENKM